MSDTLQHRHGETSEAGPDLAWTDAQPRIASVVAESAAWARQAHQLSSDASAARRPQRYGLRFEHAIDWTDALWFCTTTVDERLRLTADTETFKVAAGEPVFREGDSAEWWFGTLRGFVALSLDCGERRSRTLAGAPPGAWFGEGALLSGGRSRHGARAICDSYIAKIPAATFHWLLDRSVTFNRFVLHQLNEQMVQFTESLAIEGVVGAEARVARMLGNLFTPTLFPQGEFNLRITQRELAEFCGLSRQRFNKALVRLEDRGWISIEYGGVRILDLRSLRRGRTESRQSDRQQEAQPATQVTP